MEIKFNIETKKPLRIVLLGADGVGKTTLATELSKQLCAINYKDYEYKQRFFGNTDYPMHTAFALLQLTPHIKQDIIFDRFFYDEFVYGSVFNRSYDEVLFNVLLEKTVEQDFMIFYCYKEEPRPDELIDSKYLSEVCKRYQDFFAYIEQPDMWHLLNCDFSLQDQVEFIKNIILTKTYNETKR